MVLQTNLWQCLCELFGNLSLIESRGLKWGDVFLEKDPETGNERLVLNGGGSKTHQGQGELPSQELHLAAVRYYKEFESHRPPEMKEPFSPFFLAVKGKIKIGDPIWYMKKAQGTDKIGKVQPKKKGNKRPRLSQLHLFRL